MSVRVFAHQNGDLAIQWDDDRIYVITEGTVTLSEDTVGVLDYGTWTELRAECPECQAVRKEDSQ